MQVVYAVLVSTMTHDVEHVWLPVHHLHSVWFRRASGILWKVGRAVRSSLRSAVKRLCIWSSSWIETATFATFFHSPLLREKFCMPLFRSLVVPMKCCEAWRACRLCHFLLLQSVWYSDFILSVACYKAFGNKERGRIHCCQISIVVLFVNSPILLWHMTGALSTQLSWPRRSDMSCLCSPLQDKHRQTLFVLEDYASIN